MVQRLGSKGGSYELLMGKEKEDIGRYELIEKDSTRYIRERKEGKGRYEEVEEDHKRYIREKKEDKG